jgi:hypothetical protein
VLREVYSSAAGETFRDTFSSLGPDNENWRFNGWSLDDADVDDRNSQSIRAEVAPSFASQKQVRVAAISFTLGNWSRIAYARKLVLHWANIGATARFQMSLSDGSHVIVIDDIDLKGDQLDYNEGWERLERELDLSRLAGRNATLNLTLSASDMIALPLTKGRGQHRQYLDRLIRPDQAFSWRAMNSLTTSRALSVCGPGSATHSCTEFSNSR